MIAFIYFFVTPRRVKLIRQNCSVEAQEAVLWQALSRSQSFVKNQLRQYQLWTGMENGQFRNQKYYTVFGFWFLGMSFVSDEHGAI